MHGRPAAVAAAPRAAVSRSRCAAARARACSGRGRNTGSMPRRSACRIVGLVDVRRHRQRGDPAHAAGVGRVELEHDAVEHARHRLQLPGEVAERGALAGDLEQVGLAAAQHETAVGASFDQVRQRHRRRQVRRMHQAAVGLRLQRARRATASTRASRAVRRRAITQVSVDPNTSRTSQPKRASAAAASAVGSGAVADTIAGHRRQRDAGRAPARAGAPAWSPAGAARRRAQRRGDVRGEERLARHARRRRRAAAAAPTSPCRTCAAAAPSRPPARRVRAATGRPARARFCAVLVRKLRQVFGFGLRRAGAAGGEADRDQRIVVQLQRPPAGFGQRLGQAPVTRRRIGQRGVAEAIAVGMAAQFLGDHRRRARWRQQRGLAAHAPPRRTRPGSGSGPRTG